MIKANSKSIPPIQIERASNEGFILRVGCELFIFTDSRKSICEMCEELALYLMNPRIYELRWRKEKRHIQCNHDHDRLAENVRETEPMEVAPPMPPADAGFTGTAIGIKGPAEEEMKEEMPIPETPEESRLEADLMARRLEAKFPDSPRRG